MSDSTYHAGMRALQDRFGAVDRFQDEAHVDAHLGDSNSGEKSGANDMRCMFEARVAGLKNVAVRHHADSLHLAIEGAADKLTKALESALGKVRDNRRRRPGTGELSADAVRTADDAGSPVT